MSLNRFRRTTRALACLSCSFGAVIGGAAHASYIGASWLSVPGVKGHWTGKDHSGWIRADANEWAGRMQVASSNGTILVGDKLVFGGPNAPHPGIGGELDLAVDKDNPDLAWFMKLCKSKAVVPQVGYAESSDRARPMLEKGFKPANLPDYWEYQLKNVSITSCPVVAGAGQQGLKMKFTDIAWLNYDPNHGMVNHIVLTPEQISAVQPVYSTGPANVKSFLVTWVAPATTTTDAECPKLAAKPSMEDFYRYRTPEEAARLHAKYDGKGGGVGTAYGGGDLAKRGPDDLNVRNLPGVVPDPGQPEPLTNVADGLNLDGDDGAGAPPAGIAKHKNYTSPDGRTGIDNQLFAVFGCIENMRGRRGYENQTHNARRGDGNIVTLVQVSGFTDPMNASDVEVSFISSTDHPLRDNTNKIFIPDTSFRPTTEPNFVVYNFKVHGRIENGVITTDTIPMYTVDTGQGQAFGVYNARMRFAPNPDGSMHGLIGGYEDWRKLSGFGDAFGGSAPALYYALKSHADGMKNPVTGGYDGISMAWDLDMVPVFVVPDTRKTASVGK